MTLGEEQFSRDMHVCERYLRVCFRAALKGKDKTIVGDAEIELIENTARAAMYKLCDRGYLLWENLEDE